MITRFKDAVTIYNGKDYKQVETDDGYPVIGSGGQFAYASEYLYDGEVILLGRKGTIDKPLYFKGKFWSVDTMYYAVPKSGYCAKFLFYCAITFQYLKYSTATAIPSMTKSVLERFFIPDYTLEKQEQIAAYLDMECDKITREIDLLERKVDCYNRLRRSIINRAVTRGLNPNVPLKPSGNDWIGNIPLQWTIKRNKEFLIERKDTIGNNHNFKLLSLTLNGITIRDLDAGGKFPAEFSSYKIVSPNNLVFCLFDMDETPRTVGLSSYAGMITGAYDIFDADTLVVNPKWVYYFYLSVDQKKALKPFYTGLRKVVKSQKFANIHIPIPPLAEQNIIITYLDETCVEIDTIIEKIKLKIERLKELKRSLINEVVTGQRTIKTSDL